MDAGWQGLRKEAEMRRPLVAVFGGGTLVEADADYALALELGRSLAQAGADVMTGGYGGVMEAASRGCHEAGGHVVGVTVALFDGRREANPWVKEHVHATDLFERLRHLVGRADGFVAVPGSVGTLAEVQLTWTLLCMSARPRAPLVLLGNKWQEYLAAHRRADLVHPELFEFLCTARTPDDATRMVLEGAAAVH
jgi:uncharacterized protein (TIGR00730 family)